MMSSPYPQHCDARYAPAPEPQRDASRGQGDRENGYEVSGYKENSLALLLPLCLTALLQHRVYTPPPLLPAKGENGAPLHSPLSSSTTAPPTLTSSLLPPSSTTSLEGSGSSVVPYGSMTELPSSVNNNT